MGKRRSVIKRVSLEVDEMVRSLFRRNMNKTRHDNKEDKFTNKLVKELHKNIETVKKMLEEPDDLIIREFMIGQASHKCAIVFIDGLVSIDTIQENILNSLQVNAQREPSSKDKSELFDDIYRELISVSDVKKGKTLDDISLAILSGDTVFYLDGIDHVLMMDTKGGEFRAIDEPISETLIRGPKAGFVENLETNLALVRREIRDPNLRFKTFQIGRRSKKNFVLTYIDGIIHPDILKEVNRRLETIDMDDAPGSGYIEEWIEDSFLSPFPQMLNTERPDKVAAAILQGKFAILLDGTPFVLIAPVTIGNVLQSPEDYYERWTIGSLLRVLRYFAAFISLFLPALYISLISYQPGMIPSLLAFSIAATREGVPFPAFVEAFLMIITMELLQEAGARLPQTIGQTIGIVGGLVIGEAAVQAGMVSPVMVIVVAITAIATFAIPAYSVAISFRIIRFAFMFAASIFGLYGVILVYIMVNIHMVNLKSFGVPYTTPFAPFFKEDWKDLIFRAPIMTITKRPTYMQTMDKKSANKGEQE